MLMLRGAFRDQLEKSITIECAKLAARYHFPLVEFEDHDADPNFLIARREHPTPKGWMYYDRVLDNFFHKTK